MLINLSSGHSIVHEFLYELRDSKVQQDRLRFRRNMERLGEILAYEVSKTLEFHNEEVITSLATCDVKRINEQPVLITVLRAGVPFMNGFLNIFDRADVGFLGAYREEEKSEVSINLDYVAVPDINNKTMILIDPMLATGKSIVTALENLLVRGRPKIIHIASLIASPAGVAYVEEFLKMQQIDFSVWTCSLDEKLNAQFYIVPGLGDAGDLSFGLK